MTVQQKARLFGAQNIFLLAMKTTYFFVDWGAFGRLQLPANGFLVCDKIVAFVMKRER